MANYYGNAFLASCAEITDTDWRGQVFPLCHRADYGAKLPYQVTVLTVPSTLVAASNAERWRDIFPIFFQPCKLRLKEKLQLNVANGLSVFHNTAVVVQLNSCW